MVRRLLSVLAIAGIAALLGSGPALADQFAVTGTTDDGGTCTGGPSWTCTTLRSAIDAANGNGTDDEILLEAPGTYRLNSTLTLLHNVIIAGQGPRVTQIDGDGEFQVLVVELGVSASIFNVAIQNGNGGDGFGGNIHNRGDLTLLFTRITGGHAAQGGGIASREGSSLAVFYSLVDHNVADLGGGIDVSGTGGTDSNPSQLDVSDSTFAFNSSSNQGGGIRVEGAVDAVLLNTTIARSTSGGGIAITDAQQGDVQLYGSLLSGNVPENCPSAAKPIDEQYNLDEDTSCALDDPSSLSDVSPDLSDDLQDAGGPTDVFTFPATSPAVDLVRQCVSAIDQRGFQRSGTSEQPCDAGAYEQSAQGPPAPSISSGPSGTTTASSASFSFSTADSTATFVCQLTGPGHPGGYQPCTSPQSYSGLAPGDYAFAVAIADPTGQPSGQPTVRTFRVSAPAAPTPVPTPSPTPTPTATPVPQQSVAGKVVSGKILVKTPGGKFVPLDPTKPIPNGSEIDATHGKVELTALQKKGGALEKATFYDGIFKVTQTKTTTDLTLSQPLAPCGKRAAAAAKKPKTRKLWGDGSGSFRTRGQYSAATVRGTRWLVQDSCKGTLTQVDQGRRLRLRQRQAQDDRRSGPGRQYLARARR